LLEIIFSLVFIFSGVALIYFAFAEKVILLNIIGGIILIVVGFQFS